MSQQQRQQISRTVKETAIRHGFMGAGIARAEHMDEESRQLEAWLRKGYHGEMAYMANYFDLRTDPTKLVPGAKTVVSLLYNYFPETDHADSALVIPDSPPSKTHLIHSTDHRPFRIARYAYGEDYHKVVRRKLKAMVNDLKADIGDFHARVFVDSAPILERDWAKRSGQGWIGKNTLLIHPKKGSYFFLAEIILDIEMEYDHPIRDHCGTCTRCIEACPTQAISSEGYVLDGSKCISYLTIELKSTIPEEFSEKMEDWIFGCDICQDVCPWNRFSVPHHEPAFDMNEDFKKINRGDWLELTEEKFDDIFSKSALKRAGYKGLMRNIKFVNQTQDGSG